MECSPLIEWGKIRAVGLVQRVDVLVLEIAVLILSDVNAALEVVGIRAGADAEQNQGCDNRKENSDDQRVIFLVIVVIPSSDAVWLKR